MNFRLVIKTKQSDFDKPGKFYAANIILFLNSLLVFCILSCFTPKFQSTKYLPEAYAKTYNFINQNIINQTKKP